jgi:hypothetical protein
MNAAIDHKELKKLLKTAVAEVMEERRDLIADAVEEAMEGFALSAMKEGEATPMVDRAEVIRALGKKREVDELTDSFSCPPLRAAPAPTRPESRRS